MYFTLYTSCIVVSVCLTFSLSQCPIYWQYCTISNVCRVFLFVTLYELVSVRDCNFSSITKLVGLFSQVTDQLLSLKSHANYLIAGLECKRSIRFATNTVSRSDARTSAHELQYSLFIRPTKYIDLQESRPWLTKLPMDVQVWNLHNPISPHLVKKCDFSKKL